jgi:hypothetical protein
MVTLITPMQDCEPGGDLGVLVRLGKLAVRLQVAA